MNKTNDYARVSIYLMSVIVLALATLGCSKVDNTAGSTSPPSDVMSHKSSTPDIRDESSLQRFFRREVERLAQQSSENELLRKITVNSTPDELNLQIRKAASQVVKTHVQELLRTVSIPRDGENSKGAKSSIEVWDLAESALRVVNDLDLTRRERDLDLTATSRDRLDVILAQTLSIAEGLLDLDRREGETWICSWRASSIGDPPPILHLIDAILVRAVCLEMTGRGEGAADLVVALVHWLRRTVLETGMISALLTATGETTLLKTLASWPWVSCEHYDSIATLIVKDDRRIEPRRLILLEFQYHLHLLAGDAELGVDLLPFAIKTTKQMYCDYGERPVEEWLTEYGKELAGERADILSLLQVLGQLPQNMATWSYSDFELVWDSLQDDDLKGMIGQLAEYTLSMQVGSMWFLATIKTVANSEELAKHDLNRYVAARPNLRAEIVDDVLVLGVSERLAQLLDLRSRDLWAKVPLD